MSNKLKARIDKDRGDIPRSKFVNGLLELAMKEKENKNPNIEKTIPVDQSFAAIDQQVSIVKGVN